MITNIGLWIIRRVLKYSAFLVAPFERHFLLKYSQTVPSYPPVFIIGPPRSGSTILYQIITEYLDVLYIDNLINMARPSTWFGFWLSHLFFDAEPHHSFRSDLGKTKGLHSPNEGLFWYKWLPRERHFVKPTEIKSVSKQEMQQLIYALINKYQKPIIFKNLSFSVRLPLIRELFPDAKIIYIKRNPLFVAQSILISREKAKVKNGKLWSIRPENYQKLEKYPPVKQAVHQTWQLYRQIEKDISLFSPERIMILNYEELSDTPHLIENLRQFIEGKYRQNLSINPVSPKNEIKIDNSVFNKLKMETESLDWSFMKRH